jgi:hypothetical protein
VAEREMSSFIAAVTELYGPEQARLSEVDWLEESELMDRPTMPTNPHWRAVTIAAFTTACRPIDQPSASCEGPGRVKLIRRCSR